METIELKQSVTVKNILLATDFSDVSKKAVPYAAAIAGKYGSRIYLVHVIPTPPRTAIPVEPLPAQLDRDRLNAELEMKTFLRGDSLHQIPHETRVEQGPIGEALSELIEQDEIDLLVLGTHGRGGLKKILLGSVAEELFRRASCPSTNGRASSSCPTGNGISPDSVCHGLRPSILACAAIRYLACQREQREADALARGFTRTRTRRRTVLVQQRRRDRTRESSQGAQHRAAPATDPTRDESTLRSRIRSRIRLRTRLDCEHRCRLQSRLDRDGRKSNCVGARFSSYAVGHRA